MKPIIIFSLFQIIFCAEDQKMYHEKNESSGESVTVTDIELKTLDDEESSFQIFWKDFRASVLKGDSLKLIGMTNFPLKTHGYQDVDPRPDINRDKFFVMFKVFLSEEIYVNGKFETNMDFIRENWDIEKSSGFRKEPEGIGQRITNMEFIKLNGTWKLSLIYLDTNSFKE